MPGRKLGVIGTLVWDEIHGRDPTAPAAQEWGGIAYALAGLDAALDHDWELVPLIKVGRDLAPAAQRFVQSLERVGPNARLVEVPAGNNRVVLRYQTAERRCERMSGGVPPWTWDELGPMVRDLDAVYLNFISGFELNLGTAVALRQGFAGPIYADFHSLFLGIGADGQRALQPLPAAPSWFPCFDLVQMNEAEMLQMSPDPMQLSGEVLGAGVSVLLVTLGARGAVYVAAPGFDRLTPGVRPAPQTRGVVRTALVDAPRIEALDPTGCGDVFGATVFALLLGGAGLDHAVREGNRNAARNAAFRGASGLATHLRGSLVTP